MTVGERIKELRKSKGLTQKELALKSGVAEITIRQYESDKRQPRLEQIKHIAEVFNVYVGELLADNFDKYREEIIDDFSDKVTGSLKNAAVNTSTSYGDPEKSERMDNLFKKLNDTGQEKATEHVELLTKVPEYRREE